METEAETTGSRQEGLSPNHSAGNGKDARRDGENVAPTTTLKQPSEMAQMVCGSCRRLLSYPQGTRHVECSCCQTVNFVLEAHQVGQVKCGSCAVLLMYPYGAPSVRCIIDALHYLYSKDTNCPYIPTLIIKLPTSVGRRAWGSQPVASTFFLVFTAESSGCLMTD